ncbi:type IV secretory system conjugative DNA transfer family protein [Streptomyces sp. NPDC056723]|uniref:type IV secretory system conjugative DNA transfer family protein n=1 Tax=Streptomyces sp. NPDC056723 TaxID=3345925 RepID=UPI0036AE3D53
MSRKEESTTSTTTDFPTGPEPRRILNGYKPSKPWNGYAAAGVPAVGLAAGAENAGPPGPGLGGVLDGINTVASHWPLGGWPGFGLTIVAGGALGYLQLKQKLDLGKSGPTSNEKNAARVGFANARELKDWLSVQALRKKADVLRPTLAGIKPRAINPHDLGLYLGTDLLHRKGLYITCEDLMLIIAPPRSGKSAQLGSAVIDAAGSCIVASTRGDLYEHTHQLRREHNRPVSVFNAGVSGVQNTVRWNPVEGCEDPRTAIRRAGYFLAAMASGDDMENASFWEGHSFTVLSSYLMAASLVDGDLVMVRDWVTNSTDRGPLKILEDPQHKAHVPQGWSRLLEQMLEAPERTRDSVYLTLIRAFQFMAHPEVVQIVSPRPGEQRFDVADFLRSRGTLYVMGRDQRYGSVAPLFAALIGEIYDAAYVLADTSPGGRLDPYLRMVLDEAAVICPLPLHLWSADAGGRNIELLIAAQSISQLRERWGLNGAQTILNNSVRIVLGGLSVADDLEELSQLCGEKDEEVASPSTTDEDKQSRSISTRRVRVMPPDAIRQMKTGTGLVFYRHLPPIRYAFTPVWERKDVKELAKQAKAQEKLERKLAKQGIKVAPPAHTPQMPATAPVLPTQQPTAAPAPAPAPSPASTSPAAAPHIPGQSGALSAEPEPWEWTG